MSVFRVPVIYDNVIRQMRPAGVADLVDPAFLGFAPETLLSPAQGNMLRLRDGRLYCSGVSADTGNYLRRGSDGAVFLDGNALLSNGGAGKPNLISIDATDGKLVLTADMLHSYGVATNASVEAAFVRMKEYTVSTYVSLAALPDKVAAYTAVFATTTELDTLRVRVSQLESTVQALSAQVADLRARLNA